VRISSTACRFTMRLTICPFSSPPTTSDPLVIGIVTTAPWPSSASLFSSFCWSTVTVVKV